MLHRYTIEIERGGYWDPAEWYPTKYRFSDPDEAAAQVWELARRGNRARVVDMDADPESSDE